MLGHDIEITIVAVDGDQIKLGIIAPKQVEIHRKEIYSTIQEENKKAAKQSISMDTLNKLFQKEEK